jgi:uncharacterized protein (DUF433 family)
MTLSYQHLETRSNGDTEIRGKGLRVYTVLALYETGDSAEYIADQFDVSEAAIHEALAYALDHPEEMNGIREADEAVERELIEALPPTLQTVVARSVDDDRASREVMTHKTKRARLGSALS